MESRHRGAVVVTDADGATVLGVGEVTKPVFPRSAVKALQALPLVESGVADRYALGDEELALACASHSGEPAHVAGVARMLAKAGLDVICAVLRRRIGRSRRPAAYALARTGAPSALHNNCSGKHAGFLCLACAMGVDHAGYWRPEHAVQRAGARRAGRYDRRVLSEDRRAIDGCSVPTWAMPLQNLAHAFAKFGTGHGLAPERAARRGAAAGGLRAQAVVCRRHRAILHRDHAALGRPRLRENRRRRRYCGALPEHGLGIAIKCDDGAGRAARGDHGGGDRALSPARRQTNARHSRLSCSRRCATGTASRSARLRVTEALR